MNLEGKRAIAIGERDGIPGNAIAACLRAGGAHVILTETQCFV